MDENLRHISEEENEAYERCAKILQEEIDKEIIEKLKEIMNDREGKI